MNLHDAPMVFEPLNFHEDENSMMPLREKASTDDWLELGIYTED